MTQKAAASTRKVLTHGVIYQDAASLLSHAQLLSPERPSTMRRSPSAWLPPPPPEADVHGSSSGCQVLLKGVLLANSAARAAQAAARLPSVAELVADMFAKRDRAELTTCAPAWYVFMQVLQAHPVSLTSSRCWHPCL